MKLLGAPLALLLVPIAFSGCVGTETGNPISAELRIAAHSSDPARVAVRLPEGGVVVEEAWLVLDAIQFGAAATCEEEPAALAAPPVLGIADHAAGPPLLTVIELAAGDYCRVVVPFVPAENFLPPGAPPELASLSILISGKVPASPEPISFRIASRFSGAVDVRALGGSFSLDAENDPVFLGFDVATWLGGIDLQNALRDGNGVIVIDESFNPGLLSTFEAALASGVELYRDRDRNGATGGSGDDRLASGAP